MRRRSAISRVTSVVIAVVVIVILAGAAYALTVKPSNSTSSTTTSSTTTTTSTSGTYPNQPSLTIDDTTFPAYNLNPLWMVFNYPQWWDQATYQGLIDVNASAEYNGGTIQMLPELATSWNVSSDGLSYSFNLRQGVTFSNGDPFNSYNVWMEMYDTYYFFGNASTWFSSLPWFNMTGVNYGNSTQNFIGAHGGVVSPDAQAIAIMSNSSWPIYCPNANTIVFRIASPSDYFLQAFTIYNDFLYDTQFILNHGGLGASFNPNPYFNLNPTPGTGPYMMTNVSSNAYVVFQQNPTYWGKNLTPAQIRANPYLDPGHYAKIVVNAKADELSRLSDLNNGAAQMVSIGADNWNTIISNPNSYNYYSLPKQNAFQIMLALNVARYPTNITLVRQAISHAVNVSAIIQEALFGQATPGVGPEYSLFKSFYNLGNLPTYQYNLTLAKADLAQAGFPNGNGLPPLQIAAIQGFATYGTIAQIVQSNLAQIGVNVQIVQQTPGQFYGAYTSYNGSLANAGNITQIGQLLWAPINLAPGDAWADFVSCGSFNGNYAVYCNPTVQKCVNSFVSTTNVTEQQQLCTAAQLQVYNDVPYVWIGGVQFPSLGGGVFAPVWKPGVISSMYGDPNFAAATDIPILNTITPGPNA